jgi:hypothetical protein
VDLGVDLAGGSPGRSPAQPAQRRVEHIRIRVGDLGDDERDPWLEAPVHLLERELALALVGRGATVSAVVLDRRRGEHPQRASEQVEHHADGSARWQIVAVVVAGGLGRVDPAVARPVNERGAANLQAPRLIQPLEVVERAAREAQLGEAKGHDGVFHVTLVV